MFDNVDFDEVETRLECHCCLHAGWILLQTELVLLLDCAGMMFGLGI
jgi:hypothetical protein